MHIFIETEDTSFVERVSSHIINTYGPVSVSHGLKEAGLPLSADVEGKVVHVYYGTDFFGHLSRTESRLAQFAFATAGAMLFTNKERKVAESPIYVDKIPFDDPKKVIVALKYYERRAQIFKDAKVNYFGLTSESPQLILLMDNKRSGNLPLITKFLEHAPENWWVNLGFASTKNTAYLDEFFDDVYTAYPVALTPSAAAKLRNTKQKFYDASKLPLTDEGLKTVRENTRHFDGEPL